MPRVALLMLMTLGSFLCATTAIAMEEVVLYNCPRLTTPPVIDGKPEDPAWKIPMVAELPHKFLADVPTPAGSRSEFKAGYDDVALYLTCTFYRDSDAPLKANHKGRDDPDLWMDDSTEIYLDPSNDGHFYKFIVSNAGLVTDFHQTEAGIDYSWTAANARVATAVTEKAWSLEMSVPWKDFGQRPAAGSIWGFEVLRFTGKNWASWTVGASYNHPEKFGYLCFDEGDLLAGLHKLVQAVRKSKGDRWQLLSPYGVLQFSALTPMLEESLAKTSQQVNEARFDASVVSDTKKRTELLARLTPLQSTIDEAKQAMRGAPDSTRVQSLLTRLVDAAAVAREVEYDARMAEALEKR